MHSFIMLVILSSGICCIVICKKYSSKELLIQILFQPTLAQESY